MSSNTCATLGRQSSSNDLCFGRDSSSAWMFTGAASAVADGVLRPVVVVSTGLGASDPAYLYAGSTVYTATTGGASAPSYANVDLVLYASRWMGAAEGVDGEYVSHYAWNRALSQVEAEAFIRTAGRRMIESRRILVPVSVGSGGGPAALAGAGVLSIAGHAPNVDQSANQAVEPSAGALAITGHVPAVAQSSASSVEPNSGTLTLTGYAPTVGQAVAVAPGAGAMTVTGHVPSVLIGSYVSAEAGTVELAGYPPSVAQSANQALQPAAGDVAITGYAPSVAQASPNYFGAPEAGTISITGHEPTVTQSGQGGGALARPAKRRIVLGDRVYEVAPRDVPALLEAHLLQRKPPRTVERVGEAGDQAQQVDKPVAQAATPAPVVDAAAALQARADAMLADIRRQAAADVERVLLRIAQRNIERLIDEEEAATMLLLH